MEHRRFAATTPELRVANATNARPATARVAAEEHEEHKENLNPNRMHETAQSVATAVAVPRFAHARGVHRPPLVQIR